MLLSKEFFELNLRFASKVADVTGQPFTAALLNYSHLYLAFGLGRDFNSENSTWQAYLHELVQETDPAAFTHRFYLERIAERASEAPEHSFGCFSYALWSNNRVRLHFRNVTNERGSLGKKQMPKRLAELKAMFEHLRRQVPVSSTVVGGSWLYNIEPYRRLFPDSYLQSATVATDEHKFLALWGQFLRFDGSIRRSLADVFLDQIEKQGTLEGLKSCFPYPVLRLEAPLEDFCSYYAIR